MLPHGVGAVGRKPAVLHPASQSEAQVHMDMIIQRPMVGRHIRTQRAVSVCYFARNALSFVNKTAVLLYLFGQHQTHNVVESDVPIAPIGRISSINNAAADIPQDADNIPAF